MPKVLKGNLEYSRHRYNWKENFDGKKRVFEFKKDFDNKNSFVSTVHQAARRMGVRAMTVSKGKNVEVQVAGKIAKAKPAAKKAAKKVAKKPAKRTARKAKAKVVTNGVAADATVN
jgi:hypothetical protein